MIGNNFIRQTPSSNDNPLSPILRFSESQTIQENSQIWELSDEKYALNILNEMQKLNLVLDDYMTHLTSGGLANYSFHIITIAAQPKSEDLLEPLADLEELEIEPLDIRNPERLAHAIQNQAFVALKKQVKEEKKVEVKFAPKWAELIENRKIRQLKVVNQEGEVREKIELKDAEITYFNAAELHHLSTVIFGAIGIAYQIRALERQQLELQRKQNQQEMENRARRYREELLVERFQELLKSVERKNKERIEEDKLALAEAANCLSGSESFIMQLILTQTEEIKEQEAIEKHKQKQSRIINKEIEQFELKKENIAHENKVKEIERQAG